MESQGRSYITYIQSSAHIQSSKLTMLPLLWFRHGTKAWGDRGAGAFDSESTVRSARPPRPAKWEKHVGHIKDCILIALNIYSIIAIDVGRCPSDAGDQRPCQYAGPRSGGHLPSSSIAGPVVADAVSMTSLAYLFNNDHGFTVLDRCAGRAACKACRLMRSLRRHPGETDAARLRASLDGRAWGRAHPEGHVARRSSRDGSVRWLTGLITQRSPLQILHPQPQYPPGSLCCGVRARVMGRRVPRRPACIDRLICDPGIPTCIKYYH